MSMIIANILGLYFLGIGLAFLINTDRFKNIYQQFSKDENFLLFGGILALLIGAVIVTLHNRWVWDWTLILTILGWWSLIKGFAILAFPGFINLFSFINNRSNQFFKIISLVYLILGLFLIYKGWSRY